MSSKSSTTCTVKPPTKKSTVNSWKGKIAGNPQWAMRAAIRILQEQTSEERSSAATLESNGVGFNSFDAEIVTSIVRHYEQCGWITSKQSDVLRAKMPKYADQLYRLTHANKDSKAQAKA